MSLSYLQKTALYILSAVFFVSLDRFFKILAIAGGVECNLIKNLFKFNFAENPYIAFSLPLNGIFLNILIAAILVVLLLYFLFLLKKNRPHEAGLLSILILGAASNLFDRLKYGFVIDYLDLRYFTIFNISDIMITLTVGLLIFIKSKEKIWKIQQNNLITTQAYLRNS